MHNGSFQSRGLVVRVERGPWCRIVDVDGTGAERRPLSFGREVSWLREAGAQACLVNGAGREVDSGSGYCDVGRLLGCLPTALSEAREMAESHGVGSGPFAVVVKLTVEDIPVLALPRERWDSASTPPRWVRVPQDWIAHGDVDAVARWLALPEDEKYDDTTAVRSLAPVKVVDAAIVWDSRAPASGEAVVQSLGAALAGLQPDVADEVVAGLRADLREDADA